MKNFLRNHGLWVLAAAAIISVAMAAMSVFSSTSAPLSNLANILASPFRSAYTSVATWFNEKQAYFADVQAMEEEITQLKRKIAQMEADVRQGKLDSEENARLRNLNELRQQRRDLSDFESAYITEHSVTNWESSLTLNKGTAQGIAQGNCVVDDQGALVGVVREVGWNWCRVMTIVDTDISLGARVFRTQDLGLAEGNFSLMGNNRLRLDFLPVGCQLMGGDLVLTSGLGGFYPQDLVIGSVEEIKVDDSGAALYAVLAPAVDLSELTEVFVIKSFDIVT